MGFNRDRWKCPICGQMYMARDRYEECLNKPVTHQYAKVGDRIKVLTGDGKGEIALVKEVDVIDKEWGHYAWEILWHTQRLTVEFPKGGNRLLTFWDYENPYTINIEREKKLKRIIKNDKNRTL